MKLKLPEIRGLMRRRFLVNYRVKPEAAARLIPPPFRPRLVRGRAMAGICLIELKRLRPGFLPPAIGASSHNAAHRIAVEWDENGRTREGVFIPRRDTDSRFNELLGGRVFPGVHHSARFQYCETEESFKIELRSKDAETRVRLMARAGKGWPKNSVFGSLEEASAFFQNGSCGWSPSRTNGHCEAMELRVEKWTVEPLVVDRVESSFFEDSRIFPPGSVEFDCALLMRDVPHSWFPLHERLRIPHRPHNRHGLHTLFETP